MEYNYGYDPSGERLTLRQRAIQTVGGILRGTTSKWDTGERSAARNHKYDHYALDPVGFINLELGDNLTPDAEEMVKSLWSNPVTIAKAGNAVGKTHGAARAAVAFYKIFSDAQVYTAAAPPESNLKLLLWGEIKGIAYKHPEVFRGDDVRAGMTIKRNSQSFITGLAIPQSSDPHNMKARFSGKHAPHLLFIVDEGDAVPPEIYEAIESCMSGGMARLLIMFNPRHEAGPVYVMEKRKLGNVVRLSALNHPNVLSGEDKIPGAVTREATIRRINEWTRQLTQYEKPDHECFEVPSFLVGCTAKSWEGEEYAPLQPGYRKIMEPSFYYMVLGEYPALSETQLISTAWVDAAMIRWKNYVATYGEVPPRNCNPIGGLDVAEFGKDLNVLTFKYGGFVPMPVHWSGVDTTITADRAAEMHINANALYTNVDGNGLGAGVAPLMCRDYKIDARSIKVQERATSESELGQFFSKRDEMAWALREWLRRDKGAMLPPLEKLREELLAPTYSLLNGRIKVSDSATLREKLRRSPDHFWSLAMCFASDEDEPGQFMVKSYLSDVKRPRRYGVSNRNA